MLSLSLILFGCPSDPLEHPDLKRPTEGDVRVTLMAPEGPLAVGAPIRLAAQISSMSDRGKKAVDLVDNSLSGRVRADRWVVRNVGGHADPSPWWQDSAPRRIVPDRRMVETDTPESWTIPLNDWVRFERPGTYAVQLVTERAAGKKRVRSNAISLQVLPTDGAALESRLAEIEAALPGAEPAEKGRLLREVAWMGTPAARDLALRHLAGGHPDEPGWVLVLAMHPNESATRKALDSAIDAEDVGVGMGHVRAVEALAYDAAFDAPLPPEPPTAEVDATEKWRAHAKERAAARETARQAAFDRMRAALPSKTPTARGRTLGTLALLAVRGELEHESEVWPTVHADLDAVGEEVGLELLVRYWEEVRDPGVVPALVRLVGDGAASGELRSLALQRLVKLDAKAGQSVIEALIADPNRTVTDVDEALRALPQVSDPTQKAIIAGLATAPDRVQQARLLGQYVSADHLAAVEAAWAKEPADVETGVLAGYAAYFTNIGSPRASALLDRHGEVHFSLLNDVGPLLTDPTTLDARAIAGLQSPVLNVAMKSSDFLIDHAAPERLDTLLALVPRTTAFNQEALTGAICAGRNWLINEEQRHEIAPQLTDKRSDMVLRAVHVSDDNFVLAKGFVRDGEPVMQLNYRDYVGKQAIGAKMAQFRDGQQIKFTWTGVAPTEGEALFEPILDDAGVELFIAKN